ncbi:beta-ketoacyl synthase N-terminal-like domain-containing protein [Chromobacterium piscinae]|uniref:beta-ketoacyl synthase N-terminal-like domain-containing protein n=2 Tax=Chromobacterium piscinae TaxID=686831 RepID=UPI001E4DAD98|nr:beta-ketoacyl synthase N-terminal-like domain-containing protein [Chromobacterium piscinae]MCD5329209.1 KR domain-containing protein [Chromobacterium piscinae]
MTNELVEILLKRSKEAPNFVAYKMLNDRGEQIDKITNVNLLNKASLIASEIQYQVPETGNIILLFQNNSDFIHALFGVLYSNTVAVPLPAPSEFSKAEYIGGLLAVARDTNTNTILTTQKILDQINNLAENHFDLTSIRFVVYENISSKEHSTAAQKITEEKNNTALIMRTSESSRYIPHSHADLIYHSKEIQNTFELSKDSRALNWAPYHHYMGLFYGILQPFYSGITSYVYSNTGVIFSPSAWLAAISRYGITFAGGPTFFYDMCGTLLPEELPEDLDLSTWSVAYVGAEVLKREVINNFSIKYQHYGFCMQSFYPCFGMAEIPLISASRLDHFYDSSAITSSGKILSRNDVKVIDIASNRVCKDGEIGEVQIYIKNEVNKEIIKTNDLGYKKFDQLYILNRIENKDLRKNINDKCVSEKEDDPIAVIGLAGLFPQSDNCEEFWNNLEQGRDLISEIPGSRWDWKEIYGDPDNKNRKTNIKWGGFINDVETFDASFFNISPKEAQLMDPMQRKLIQVVWQAVEDAGYRMRDLSGQKVGVIVGIGTFDYLQLVLENDQFTHAYAATGTVHCMASNRISYLFNFKGPSESVDTACSSSLVALHRAAGLIRNNECEIAIVCGANLLLSSSIYVALSNANMLSPSGQCKTFDESADGYVRGEGIAAIVLKKLSSSISDKDHVYGLIKGIAVNHGGHTNSLTAPNPFAQAEVIEDAVKMAKICPKTISYVETHGTGTSLGDPIEINGLVSAFKTLSNRSNIETRPYCALGSVKTNIGHLEAAAGLAGVIKVLLSMQHKKIPAHLHLSKQNKNIFLEESPFYLIGNTTEWEALKDQMGEDIPRRAGVSSFGFGGVNAHVVLEEYDAIHSDDHIVSGPNIFIFSAKTENALRSYIDYYRGFLSKQDTKFNLNDMAYTLQTAREPFDYRLAVISSEKNDLIESLSSFLRDDISTDKQKKVSIYFNQVKSELSNIIFGFDRKGMLDLEKHYLNNNDLYHLAQLWILGADVEWRELYNRNSQAKKVSLPSYPFEKAYHWINKIEQKESAGTENLIRDTYDINWYEMPLVEGELIKDKAYLLFCDNQGVGQEFYDLLRKKNIQTYKVNYKGTDDHCDDTYIVTPGDKNSYLKALHDIVAKTKNKALCVINFWPLDIKTDPAIPSLTSLSTDYRFACQTALEQLQSLVAVQQEIKLYLWTICANVQKIATGKVNLHCAPLWGMAKTLLVEHPFIFRSIIDVDISERLNLNQLYKETSSLSEEGEIVYRKNIRYVPRLTPSKVEPKKPIEINPNGVYLITGGLGSLGLLVAEWLSSFKVKKILLLSRRGVEQDAQREAIKLIEGRGTTVETIRADVSSLDQMRAVKNSYIKGNELSGVFHLAGSYKECLLQDMTFDEFYNVTSMKVEGTWVLNEVFKVCQLDWFVMFSSCASVWGAATGGHYSAANYFLDAYADYGEIYNFPAISISWGGMWKDSGIIPENKVSYFGSIGIKETSPKVGLQQLESILASFDRKKVVAPVEWPLFLEVMNTNRKVTLLEKLGISPDVIEIKASSDNQFPEKLSTYLSNDEKYLFILDELKSIFVEILSISHKDSIDDNTGFFDLGMDSLTSIDFRNKIKKIVGVKVTTTALFDYNTLRLLTNHLLIDHFKIDISNNTAAQESSKTHNLSEFDNVEKDELLNLLKSEMDNITGE